MQGVCRGALPRYNVAGYAPGANALLDQNVGIFGIIERLGQPLIERLGLKARFTGS